MNDPHSVIIEEAREMKPFRCGRCSYLLDGVPVDEQKTVVCPECGYTMRFVVSIRLVADDPEYDREVRQSLGRTERIIGRLAILILVVVCALALTVIVFDRVL